MRMSDNNQKNSFYNKEKTMLKSIIKQAPSQPGVYQFFDAKKKLLYIGKAKNLIKRLSDYMLSNLPLDKQEMIKKAVDVKWFTTETEKQALFLEAELIEKYKPTYNIQYQYGKRYYYLHLTNGQFPRVFIHNKWSTHVYSSDKQAEKKDSLYIDNSVAGNVAVGKISTGYGPFETDIRNILESVCVVFKLRTCTDHVFKTRKRPCLEYDLQRCSAPCVNLINQQEYMNQVQDFKTFFKNGDLTLLNKWQEELFEATEKEEYELANVLFKRIQGLEGLTKFTKSNGVELETDFADFFISSYDNDAKCVYVLGVREKRLKFKVCILSKAEENIEELIARWYVQNKLKEENIAIYTNEKLMKNLLDIKMYRYQFPKINALIENIIMQSKFILEENIKQTNALKEYAKELGLEKIERVEIYDNSHM